jgi:pimeloyl-ACP methyl ester carboxylesterase
VLKAKGLHMDIQPFTVQIPEAELVDLQTRLARTRWPDEIAGADWEYGANLAYLQDLVRYWQEHFDWRAQERAINAFAHFRATVAGLGIHIIHQRGNGPAPLPLIITHGWPGSFVEMLKIVPLLSDPARYGGDAQDAFDVVIPSLPGYGFSDRPGERGMHPFRIADLWAKLMAGLGYQRFGAQGGDWGSSVATCLGFAHPDTVVGIHLNYIPGSYAPYLGPGARELSAAEQAFLQERERWLQTEGGYGQIQRTKPQTLAYGLNDSPAGLAAWIVEKFRAWSDCDGDVERRFSKDELLTNIAIYWFTQTIGSSSRLYYEGRQRPLQFNQGERIAVPCGVARLPKEAPMPPHEWVERCYNLQHWAELPRGGHFAALEEPELLAQDIRAFFRPLR